MEIIVVFVIGIIIGYLFGVGRVSKAEDDAIQAWKDAALTLRKLADKQQEYIDQIEKEKGL